MSKTTPLYSATNEHIFLGEVGGISMGKRSFTPHNISRTACYPIGCFPWSIHYILLTETPIMRLAMPLYQTPWGPYIPGAPKSIAGFEKFPTPRTKTTICVEAPSYFLLSPNPNGKMRGMPGPLSLVVSCACAAPDYFRSILPLK